MVVTGRRVGVFGGKLDASGGTGGGEILLGGDYQGMNPLVRNAERTYVSEDSIISADATVAGDGGKIISWSDNGTQFYGSATAKGGAVSGNGGFVEVSGRDFLDYQGFVNTLAPQGLVGTLLLDPTDMTIVAGSSTTNTSGLGTLASPWVPSASGSTLGWSNIDTALATAAVFITTSGSPDTTGQTGTITISGNSGSLNRANNLNITATSGGNITINGSIANSGAGTLTMNVSGGGAISIGNNITFTGLTLNGGPVSQSAGTTITVSGTTTLNMGSANSATLTGAANNFGTVAITSGNAVFLTDANALALGASTVSGNLTINAGGPSRRVVQSTLQGSRTSTRGLETMLL